MTELFIQTWSGPLASLLAVISIVYTWLTARSKANEGKISGHEKKLTAHDRRIQGLEAEVKHLPRTEDVHDLRVSLEQVKGSLGRLEESHIGINRAVRRMEEFLMKGTS
ncbi:DUF2730 family protein [Nitratireductor soli]|uniref:DUF2730 family protein n=1 Tax=Nitratireductor soli TaxID=1670619 RepID=UPI00065DD565|nr:DUF2730 family protein [Nitratireductor soli]